MMLEITNLINELKNSTFWLSGDFNLPYINWLNQRVVSKRFNELFIDMINKLAIDEIVDFPTRKDNILDFFLCKSTIINK